MTAQDARALRQLGVLFLAVALGLACLALLLGTWRELEHVVVAGVFLVLGVAVTATAQLLLKRATRSSNTGTASEDGPGS